MSSEKIPFSDTKFLIAVNWSSDNEFTVKRVNVSEEGLFLMPENADFNPIKITSEMNFQVWGVVTYIIHKAN